MNKPIIAIDIDDVLSETVEGFMAWSNETYGTSLKVSDYNEDIATMWNVDREESERRAKNFHGGGAVGQLRHINAARPVLAWLADRYELVVITSRRVISKDQTEAWLNKYFPGIFSPEVINFAGIWDNADEQSHNRTKGDIVKKLGASYLIDDQIKHCVASAELGIETLLFGDYTWNQADELPEGVVRVKDWLEVRKYFDERS